MLLSAYYNISDYVIHAVLNSYIYNTLHEILLLSKLCYTIQLTIMIPAVLPVFVTGTVADESALSTGGDRMLQQ